MFGEIYVVNIKNFDKTKVSGEVVNIMRPSILGNPFKMEKEDDREISVVKFYHYLRDEYAKKDMVYKELFKIYEILKTGKDVYLVCCCAPKLCHGDIIKNALKGMLKNVKISVEGEQKNELHV